MFTWLLDFSLKNRMMVILLSLIAMGYGLFTLSKMPVDVFPDLNKPTVTIMTEAGGMASEEVEQLITFPLETAMNGLPGVEAIRSVSSAGLSFIYVTFDWSVDIYRARQMVSERLSSMEGAIPDGIVSRMAPLARSWVKLCRLPFQLMSQRFHPCKCANMPIGCFAQD